LARPMLATIWPADSEKTLLHERTIDHEQPNDPLSK